MRRLATLLIAVLLIAWPEVDGPRVFAAPEAGPATEPLVIVVNRSNPIDGLTSAELRRIFLGNRSHWANGRRITLVMREPGEPERTIILRDVCGMSDDQLKNHFLHGLYTGEILVSPKILSSASVVLDLKRMNRILDVSERNASCLVEPGASYFDLCRYIEDKGYKLRLQTEGVSGN